MPIVADQVGGDIRAALKAFACANPADAKAIAAIRADPNMSARSLTTCRPWSRRPRRKCASSKGDREHQLPHLSGVSIEAVRAELRKKVVADPAS